MAAAVKDKNTTWLVDHINAECGTEYDAPTVRVMLRALAERGKIKRDGEGPRARWMFSGEKDPNVKAIVKHVSSGEADAERQKKLDELKAKREKSAAAKKAAKAKPAPAPVEDDLDDLEELD